MSALKGAFGLAGEVARRRSEAIADATQKYPRLLESDDAKQAGELHEAMETLGKGVGDLSADTATLKEYRRWQAVMENGLGLEDQIQAAAKELADHNEETQRIVERRRETHRAIVLKGNELGGRVSNAQTAFHQLKRLQAAHPQLLMHESLPPEFWDVERQRLEAAKAKPPHAKAG